jgi:hypothetical protein
MDRGGSTRRDSRRFLDPATSDWRPSGTATIVPAATDATGLVESLLAQGERALELDGDLCASRSWFEQAHQAAEQSGDPHAMARAALGLAGLWVHEHRTATADAGLRARLQNALSLAEPQSPDALLLRVRLAGENDYRSGEHAAIMTALDEATRAGDPAARATALSLAHHCVLGPDHGELRRRLATELIAESFRTSGRSDLLMGMLWRTVDMFLDADPHAERSLGELRDLLAQRDHLAVGFVVSAIEVMMAIRAGRFDEAETQLEACAERGAAAGDIDARGWRGGQLVAIRWYQGRLAELLPMVDDLVHSPTLSAVDNSYFAALAVAAALAGDRRKAAGALARLRGHDLADLPRSSTWLVTMNGVVEAAHLLGDADTASRAYELLSPFGHLPMMASLGVACFGSVRHALGVACLTTGDTDQAVRHLRAAIDRNLAIGHWPAVMMSRLRYAQALAKRAGPEDAAAARNERATATSEASALGIPLPLPGEVVCDDAIECSRHGRNWRVTLGSRSVAVEHSIGLLHLAVLIANPRREIPAIDLVAGVEAVTGGATRDAGSAQPVLDRTAIREYRHRLSQLPAEIDALEARNDTRRAAQARAEREWLIAALSGASSLGDRTRCFTDDPERARIAVGKSIRRAITRIAEMDAVIGETLRGRIRTGIRCSYWPG